MWEEPDDLARQRESSQAFAELAREERRLNEAERTREKLASYQAGKAVWVWVRVRVRVRVSLCAQAAACMYPAGALPSRQGRQPAPQDGGRERRPRAL